MPPDCACAANGAAIVTTPASKASSDLRKLKSLGICISNLSADEPDDYSRMPMPRSMSQIASPNNISAKLPIMKNATPMSTSDEPRKP
jgi:hypothetical protein